MKYTLRILASVLLMSVMPAIAQQPASRKAHSEMHQQLLAKQSNSIDKSALQDYIQQDLLQAEEIDPQLKHLSTESAQMISDLLSEARTHTGKRYVYGSAGPNTFDCSGFTGYVYKQFGYKLSRSSRDQYSNGIPVDISNLRPGDLVFFTSPRSGKAVGHVGMVVEADNANKTFKFIHASISHGIEVQKSTMSYYQKRYVGARRIITK